MLYLYIVKFIYATKRVYIPAFLHMYACGYYNNIWIDSLVSITKKVAMLHVLSGECLGMPHIMTYFKGTANEAPC